MQEMIAGPDAAGQRLDRFAADAAGVSRAQAHARIAAGEITVNGRAAKPSQALVPGDVVRLAPAVPAQPSASVPAPEAIPLQIVYEDRDLLVIDKPAGMVVHPAPGHRAGTLVNALLAHTGGDLAGDDATRPGIVHRLDRDTSGLLLVARSAAALAGLSQQMRARSIEKHYTALVEGWLEAPVGAIDAPIGRDPRHRQRMAVVTNGGRAALTRYVVERLVRGRSLLTVRLVTGRTHQIRVHFAAVGHPVVGDPLYGRKQPPMPPRIFLHAARLALQHPVTAAPLTFSSPLPPDLTAFLALLEGNAGTGDATATS